MEDVGDSPGHGSLEPRLDSGGNVYRLPELTVGPPSHTRNVERNRLTPIVAFVVVGVPFLFLLVIHLLVAERSATGSSRWLSFSPDTNEYAKMVGGGRAAAPFTYRRLVPLLASLIPLPPTEALWAITQFSVVAGYAVLL